MLQRVHQLHITLSTSMSTSKDQSAESADGTGQMQLMFNGPSTTKLPCITTEESHINTSQQQITDPCEQVPGNVFSSRSYRTCKLGQGSVNYVKQWQELRQSNVFRDWIEKPDYLEAFELLKSEMN